MGTKMDSKWFKKGELMEGACSNQVVKCIVFSNDLDVGSNKLLEIEKEKNSLGIITTHKRIFNDGWMPSEIIFDDGEEWIIVRPLDTARAYRWRKAWVDVKVSIEQWHNLIIPTGSLYQWEKEKYFNYTKYE
jgi:hypothetical protein